MRYYEVVGWGADAEIIAHESDDVGLPDVKDDPDMFLTFTAAREELLAQLELEMSKLGTAMQVITELKESDVPAPFKPRPHVPQRALLNPDEDMTRIDLASMPDEDEDMNPVPGQRNY